MSTGDYAIRFIHDRVYVFSLKGCQPAADGWRAKDFSEGKDHMWAGILKLTSSTASDKNYVILEHDKRDGKTGVFATCEATRENIEPTSDSSRFFVLRISNASGQVAFIGVGFQDKQPALDFKSELASLTSKAVSKIDADIGDFSLGSGEKITLNLGGKAKHASTSTANSGGSSGASLNNFVLAPPTASTRVGAPTTAAGASSSSAAADLSFLLSTPAPTSTTTAATSTPAPTQPVAAAAAAAPAKKFDFGNEWDF